MNSKGNQIPSALIVVAPRDFRDEEYLDVHAQLVEAGFLVQVASTQTGRIKGLFGTWIEADLSLSQAKASQFDAVVLLVVIRPPFTFPIKRRLTWLKVLQTLELSWERCA